MTKYRVFYTYSDDSGQTNSNNKLVNASSKEQAALSIQQMQPARRRNIVEINEI